MRRTVAFLHGLFALDIKLLGYCSTDRYAFYGKYRDDRRGRYTGEP